MKFLPFLSRLTPALLAAWLGAAAPAQAAPAPAADTLMKQAAARMTEHDFVAAMRLYQRAIGANPRNALAFVGLGLTYLHGGDTGLARAAFAEALRLEPARRAQLAPVLARLEVNTAAEPARRP